MSFDALIRAALADVEGLMAYSAEWHRRYREAVLRDFPDIDQRSRNNLDKFVRDAERREREGEGEA